MKIIKTSSFVPSRSEANEFFIDKLGLNTSVDWIQSKTGITSRHYAFPNQTTSDLAYEAAAKIVTNPLEIDFIIVATTTPDMSIPSCATFLQRKLKCSCPAVDINNACSGFVYALDMAYQYIKCGTYKKILVVGADCSSHLVNFADRLTSVFFGDGAGCVIVEKSDKDCVLARYLAAEGCHEHISTAAQNKLTMNGKAIWEFANKVFPETILKLCEISGKSVEDIDWIVPHQANAEMIKSCLSKINYHIDKTIINIDKYGNTISATIPIALHEAVVDGRIKSGDIVALVGYGAGLAWGGILMEA